MKKLLLCAAIAVFGLTSINAQGGFKAGINAGLPIGDAGDLTTFAIAVDLGYLFEVSDAFEVGPTVSYQHFLKDKDIITEDISFLPIGAAARFGASDKITLGADLGYAIGVNPSGVDSGFYYSPRVQYGLSEAVDLVLSYRGISLDGITLSTIGLGAEFSW
ncbi:outer membrane beta-barrel protein [Flavivirga sp. 57AJ16]|uniref:outer membrane beta-barrel protein n=1 Tax=Flavivirga sp. 57AJ16 TaxID=3025307 RepID=UPI0023653C5B|nr:outer membrane beta-barrel protein [Flavivirga sp. 57AJ16]MDD7886991.1 outer membrane beta-barrel protein [Flavivirga sp. 57AJ16]